MSVSSLTYPGNGLLVLYYGDPLGADATRIRALNARILIVGEGQEVRPEVPAFHRTGDTRVLVYVAVGFGKNDVASHIDRALTNGYDGIFFDEAESTDERINAELAARVRSHGSHLVVMNPGRAQVDPSIFDHADIVSVENQWDRPLGPTNIPPWRWMAVQGDPARDAADTLEEACRRYDAFRERGGYWYYSPPRASVPSSHWMLPPWIEDFAAYVRSRT